ncbi:MAG: hypothetical protein FWF71_02520 [Actinomycetia bacterium]|nr:hypothetical protein [Actinomycetes bacterium]
MGYKRNTAPLKAQVLVLFVLLVLVAASASGGSREDGFVAASIQPNTVYAVASANGDAGSVAETRASDGIGAGVEPDDGHVADSSAKNGTNVDAGENADAGTNAGTGTKTGSATKAAASTKAGNGTKVGNGAKTGTGGSTGATANSKTGSQTATDPASSTGSSADNAGLYPDTNARPVTFYPENAARNYVTLRVSAINSGDFGWIASMLQPNSAVYQIEKQSFDNHVSEKTEEELLSARVVNIEYSQPAAVDDPWVFQVYVVELIKVKNENHPTYAMQTNKWIFTVTLTDDSTYITDIQPWNG